MERSMNGKFIPIASREIKALVAYLEWLGRYAPNDGKIEGKGFTKLEIPKRPVNLEPWKACLYKTLHQLSSRRWAGRTCC